MSQRSCALLQGARHRITVLAALYRDTTVAPQPRYNVLYRESPLPSHASALPHALCADRPYRGLYLGLTTSCHGRGLVVSWPLQLCPTALFHDTIHCIMTQMGSSPSSCCLLRNFFFHSFFFSFVLLEDHTPKKKKFSFSNRTKNIYFKFFFPVLHTVKPRKKFPLHFFFSSLVASLLLLDCNSLDTTIHTLLKFYELHFNPISCAKTGINFQNFTKPFYSCPKLELLSKNIFFFV